MKADDMRNTDLPFDRDAAVGDDIPSGPLDESADASAEGGKYDPLDPDGDSFKPPDIPKLVHCIHCGSEYESYLIEWRIETDHGGKPHGFWCCPVDECDGRGYGFDIFPIDPEFHDEVDGWYEDDCDPKSDEFDDDERLTELDPGDDESNDDDRPPRRPGDNREPLPF